MPPSAYEITCDSCGGSNIEWSELEGCVWCRDCKIDTPGNEGIFNGPISLQACELFGISFDRIDLKTGKRMYMAIEKDKLIWSFSSAKDIKQR